MSTAAALRMGGITRKEIIKTVFTEEQLQEKRAEFIDLAAEITELENEKKEIAKDYSDRIKPKKAEAAALLKETKQGFINEEREVTCVANDTDGTVDFFDKETGNQVGYREQYPSERVRLFEKPNTQYKEFNEEQ